MDLFYFEIDNGDMSAIEDMDRGGGIAWASGDPLLAPQEQKIFNFLDYHFNQIGT